MASQSTCFWPFLSVTSATQEGNGLFPIIQSNYEILSIRDLGHLGVTQVQMGHMI